MNRKGRTILARWVQGAWMISLYLSSWPAALAQSTTLNEQQEGSRTAELTPALGPKSDHDSDSDKRSTSFIRQAIEQNLPMASLPDTRLLTGSGQWGSDNDTYLGIKTFWNNDIVGNLFPNIGQLLGRWLSEWIDGWVADTVGMLTGMLRTFFMNPNIAAHGPDAQIDSQGQPNSDDISPLIRQAASVMYAIALDLLLVLFVLAIWRYWTEAAWRGGMGVMGAVARLIFTAGLMLAWPTICALEIEISNQMIKAVFFNVTDQVQMLDATMATTVKAGLVATSALLAKSLLPTLGNWTNSTVGLTISGAFSTIALIIFLILTTILVAQLIFILIMKAVQTVLLAAQYMFAPVFLIFFATPDTENVASSYIKSCIEVSLWSFAWLALLKLMTILLFSPVSPWGKILMAIAILQVMIQVPSFLARASISPLSPFAASGLIPAGLKTGALKLGSTLFEKSMSLASAVTMSGNQGSAELLPMRAGERGIPEQMRSASLSNSGKDLGRHSQTPQAAFQRKDSKTSFSQESHQGGSKDIGISWTIPAKRSHHSAGRFAPYASQEIDLLNRQRDGRSAPDNPTQLVPTLFFQSPWPLTQRDADNLDWSTINPLDDRKKLSVPLDTMAERADSDAGSFAAKDTSLLPMEEQSAIGQVPVAPPLLEDSHLDNASFSSLGAHHSVLSMDQNMDWLASYPNRTRRLQDPTLEDALNAPKAAMRAASRFEANSSPAGHETNMGTPSAPMRDNQSAPEFSRLDHSVAESIARHVGIAMTQEGKAEHLDTSSGPLLIVHGLAINASHRACNGLASSSKEALSPVNDSTRPASAAMGRIADSSFQAPLFGSSSSKSKRSSNILSFQNNALSKQPNSQPTGRHACRLPEGNPPSEPIAAAQTTNEMRPRAEEPFAQKFCGFDDPDPENIKAPLEPCPKKSIEVARAKAG